MPNVIVRKMVDKSYLVLRFGSVLCKVLDSVSPTSLEILYTFIATFGNLESMTGALDIGCCHDADS